METLLTLLEQELDIQQTEKRIRGRVKQSMEKSQRDYYLHEQVKAIQKELGQNEQEFTEYEEKIVSAKMSEEATEKANSELKKLRMMGSNSAEANVIRNYLDTMLGLPWSKRSRINCNLTRAAKVLDEDHYGFGESQRKNYRVFSSSESCQKVRSPILLLSWCSPVLERPP